MKYSVITSLIIFTSLLLFSSCNKEDIKIARYYSVNISLLLPEEEAEYKEKVEQTTIEIVNQQTSHKYVLTGEYYQDIWQTELPSGEYNISAILKLEEDNDSEESILSFNGKVSSVGIYSDNKVSLALKSVKPSPIIFKEIYYSMSKTTTGDQYTNDQFYEIYNNSSKTQYLDNCILARTQGSGSAVIPCRWVDANGEILMEYPTDSYIAAFEGDGSGKKYPLEPGKSVVVAYQAKNHRTQINPNSVDLSNANYEVNISDYVTSYANNPAVSDMSIITKSGDMTITFWMLPYSGTSAILAKFPDNINLKEYAADMANYKTIPFQTVNTTLYLMVPQDYVMDGVNIVGVDPAKRQVQLRAEVDAGMVTNSAVYNGKSIKRKVKSVVNGRVVYQDTNNSSNDFLTDQTPTPGVDANGNTINK